MDRVADTFGALMGGAADHIKTTVIETASIPWQALELTVKRLTQQMDASARVVQQASENVRDGMMLSTLLLYFSLVLVLWWQSLRTSMSGTKMLLWMIPAVLAGAVFFAVLLSS